jgi:hypothetical protein
VLRKKPGDQSHSLLRPVKEVHLDVGAACPLERGDLVCRKRRRVPVHRYHRMPGRKKDRGGCPGGESSALRRLLADQVVKRLTASVGGEPFHGDDALAGAPGQPLAGDQGAIAWMVFGNHGFISIMYAPRRATSRR